jgi:hypothetical protein
VPRLGRSGKRWEAIVKHHRRKLALPLALALALGAAACGGGSSTATSGAGGAAATAVTQSSAAAQPTDAPSAAASEAVAPQGGNETSVTAGGITLPARVGAVTYTTNEYTGDRLAMFLPFKSDELDRVLDAQGKTRDDTVLAIAGPDDFAWPTVNAIRITGGDAKALSDQIQQGAYTSATWEQTTVGGKSVAKATSSEGNATVLYSTGDILYMVYATNPSLLDGVVAALP